ncbi:restriction endonuclease subunit S [Oceanobacillus jeddahense]|uniref:restriction endonuclease subunit S n=1 Tax=Oceanobacillus jeddahense TaxID=1462527 RepID=UPI0005960A3C|nr:restriction endonuclease subunit S [Oceanobacillus jeddahense]
MKLEDIVTVKVGRNLSRENEIYNQSLNIYTYEDLTDDLNGFFLDLQESISNGNTNYKDNHLSRVGEVVFSFVSSKAALVSDVNKGKVINQNFAKLIIKYKQLDCSYLCYVLNESNYMKKQMSISMQGSTVRKLTPAILKSLELKLPTIEKQEMIGKAYLKLKKRQALAKKQADLEEQLYLEVLKQLEQS